MSRPRLRHRARTFAVPPGSLAAILPLPLLMGGCASDEDELQADTSTLARPA
jgi:hypothetical protein